MSHYYKLVNKDYYNGNLYSLNAPAKLRITYIPNAWIKAVSGTGGVFIFKEFSDAKNFASTMGGDIQIWKCKVKNPRKLKYRAESGWSSSIFEFWKNYLNLRKSHKSVSSRDNLGKYSYTTPEGTYLASEVMLVEKCQ